MKRTLALFLAALTLMTAIVAVPSGADYGRITLTADNVTVAPGTATAEIVVAAGNIPTDLGLASVWFSVDVDNGAEIKSVAKLVPTGSTAYDSNKRQFMWADAETGVFTGSAEIAKITVTLPEKAKGGDVFNLTIGVSDDDDNYLTLKNGGTGEQIGLGATGSTVKIRVQNESAYGKITLTAEDVEVAPGAATAEIIVVAGSIPTDLGLGTAYLNASVDNGAEVTGISKLVPTGSGSFQNGEFLWADAETGIFTESAELAKITVKLPDGAKKGDEFTVTIGVDDDYDNYLTFNVDPVLGDTVGLGAIGGSCRIIVAENDPTIPGDLNRDGKLNSRDIVAVMKLAIPGAAITPEQLAAADLNGDGKLNSRDVIAVMKLVLAQL